MTPKNSLRLLYVAVVLQLGVLSSYAQTSKYFFTGSEAIITLNPGTYDITAYGARGGQSGRGVDGGLGAEMSGRFFFSRLTTLTILVGGGGNGGSPLGVGQGGGGGGGSFVVNGGTPLVIAGGGGGCYGAWPGQTSSSGGFGSGGGGSNGSGGRGGYDGGAGGGGYSGNGGDDGYGAMGGSSFLNGGAGGGQGYYGGGGYGGGGRGSSANTGGGAGGYSGGGGGGGGGGSYIDSSAVVVLSEVSGIASPDNLGNGEIIISAVLPTQPTNITFNVSENTLYLSWPSNYVGWILQTNSISLLTDAGWHDMFGSQTNSQVAIQLGNPGISNVYFRLRRPQ